MSIAFKHPEFLFFLFAIAIPIIIHLFSFRKYKKVYFHNFQFIKAIQVEQNSTKSKLKEILILASRIGLITFLTFAFAQPYIPLNNKTQQKGKQAVAIYIDNSFSTQSETSNGTVLEIEKAKAQQIADAYSAETKFFLFTNVISPTELYPKTRDEIKNAITEITLCPTKMMFSNVCTRISTCAMKNEMSCASHIITDLQKNSFDLNAVTPDSTSQVFVHYIENQTVNNISIDSCYFENHHHVNGQTEKIYVRISNNSEDAVANLPVKLYIKDSLKAIAPATIKPHATVSVPIEYSTKETGIISCRLAIEDYPILYDNTYYFSYFIDNQINILNVYEKMPNQYINALCKGKKNFTIENSAISAVDYSNLNAYSVIILDQLHTIPTGLTDAIAKLANFGKSILCIPAETIDIDSYNQFFANFGRQQISAKDSAATKIADIDQNNSIFKFVFEKKQQNTNYPDVLLHYPLSSHQNNALITLQDGQPFVTQLSKGKNTLFTFSAPFSDKAGSFVTSPLFVGIYNMLLFVSNSNELQTTLGQQSQLYLANFNNDEALHIENRQKNIDVIPQLRIDLQSSKININPMQQIPEAGNYTITEKGRPIAGLSYNYDRSESQLNFYTLDDISEQLSTIFPHSKIIEPTDNITAKVKEQTEGIPLWRIALITAIIFILLEVFVIVWYDKLFLKDKTSKITP